MMCNQLAVRTPSPRFALAGLFAGALVVGGMLAGCGASLQPVGATTRLNDHPASDVVLSLPEDCSMVPGNGPPGGRPEGVHAYTLPAGNYLPRFQDEHGVFFASPTGVVVAAPAPKGTRSLPGGIYIHVRGDKRDIAMQYLGDLEGGVSERDRLPEHCHYSIQNLSKAAPAQAG